MAAWYSPGTSRLQASSPACVVSEGSLASLAVIYGVCNFQGDEKVEEGAFLF